MSATTTIEWTDATASPWLGCTKVSEGCADCYLPRQTPLRVHGIKLGAGEPRHRATSFRIGMVALNNKAVREGRRIRVFPSLCDWLDPEVPVEWLADFLDLIRLTPALDWQLLTKRPQWWGQQMIKAAGYVYAVRSASYLEQAAWITSWCNGTAPANVWSGWTAENQARMDERTPHGLKIPARVRFVSVEPMLGPVDIQHGMGLDYATNPCFGDGDDIHWVICGGESGPKARPMHPDWARSLRDQCAAAGVPFFFKQWGEWAPSDGEKTKGEFHFFRDGQCMERVGKKAAGRLLDGREHNEFPEVRRG